MNKAGRKKKELNADGTLTCCDCEQDKPLEDFYKDKTKTHGVQAYCKKCNHKRASERYNKRKEKIQQKIYIREMELRPRVQSLHWGKWHNELVKSMEESKYRINKMSDSFSELENSSKGFLEKIKDFKDHEFDIFDGDELLPNQKYTVGIDWGIEKGYSSSGEDQ